MVLIGLIFALSVQAMEKEEKAYQQDLKSYLKGQKLKPEDSKLICFRKNTPLSKKQKPMPAKYVTGADDLCQNPLVCCCCAICWILIFAPLWYILGFPDILQVP
jgi:hypothetical protein